MEEGKNIEVPPKESLVYGVKWDIDGSTYFMESKGKNKVIKESYYEPRSEEEKKQIVERNQKRREQEAEENKRNLEQQVQIQEKSQNENSSIQETTQPNSSQKTGNQESSAQKSSLENGNNKKNNNSKNIYYGVGAILLVLLMISLWVGLVKKKRKLK